MFFYNVSQFKTKDTYGPGFEENRYPLYYRRAASYPAGTYVYSHPTNPLNGQGYTVMMMARAWHLGAGKKSKIEVHFLNYLSRAYFDFK